MEIKELKLLLEQIGLIDYKYQKLNEQDEFNVFSVIRNPNDEVNLHSRFLHELLNPEARHKQRDVFLNLFLEEIVGMLPNGFVLHNPKVFREYKNIDILIKGKDSAIIIENKLDAGDQSKQLERYFNIIKEEKIESVEIFYLTKDGHNPNDNSTGVLKGNKEIHTISYRNNITSWLEKCIKEVSLFPTLRETIKQYLNLIKELTGQTTTMEEQKEIFELLKKDDNFRKARLIANNFDSFFYNMIWNFWADFEDVMEEKGFNVLSKNRDNRNSTEKAPNWLGTLIEVKKNHDGESICLAMEDERSNAFIYGCRIMKGNEELDATIEKYDSLAGDIIEALQGNKTIYERKEHYIAPSRNRNKFNIHFWGDIEKEKLYSDKHRKQFIEKFVDEEIMPFLRKAKLIEADKLEEINAVS